MTVHRKQKTGMRRKLTLLICLPAIFVIVVGLILAYLWGMKFFQNTIGESHVKMAQLLAEDFSGMIDERIADMKIHASRILWQNAIKEANAQYIDKDDRTIKEYLETTDKAWIGASDNAPLIKKYLNNEISTYLREVFLKERKEIAEIFLTDKFGGLVASSGRTSDFYQADETWWQETFNGGKGKLFIESGKVDQSTGILAITFAIPVIDKTEDVIGILIERVDVRKFFEPMKAFKIGKTGHAVIIDQNGFILYREGVEPLSRKFIEEKNLTKLLTKRNNWIVTNILDEPNSKRMFIASALVKHPLFTEKTMQWKVCIEQDVKEVFSPLNALLIFWSIFGTMMILVLTFMSFVISGIFIKPIHYLHDATDRIVTGDLSYKVNIKTGDELEQLADSFNIMTSHLEKSTTSIDNLNREITERKKAEEKIRRAEEEWSRTFNSISDMVFIQDTNFTIIKVNKAFADTLKMKPEDIIGRKCYEVLHKKDKPFAGCPFEQTQKDKKMHVEEINDPNIGIPLLVTTSPIFDDNGNLKGSVHIAKDITQIKETERILRESLEAKSRFTSTVSHELRTPLTAIKEGIDIVYDGSAGAVNDEQKDFLEIAKRNVDRLTRLINEVLDYQKLEAGKMPFDLRENDINETILEVYNSMKPLAQGKNLKFNIKLDDTLPKIKFDRDKIIQVLNNLINNALKFTDKGSVEISTLLDKNSVRVSISDTGPGITPEDMPKLFQSFKQLGNPQNRKTGGTGLGLVISREIILGHKGKIWADSKPGKGATFHFALPVKE